jgi:hypothetical protein
MAPSSSWSADPSVQLMSVQSGRTMQRIRGEVNPALDGAYRKLSTTVLIVACNSTPEHRVGCPDQLRLLRPWLRFRCVCGAAIDLRSSYRRLPFASHRGSIMYRAYDRHLYERFTDTPATPKIDPLAADKLDPRVVVHPLLYCPPLAHGVRYLLVRREWPGMRHVQAIGRAGSRHESINLATVRLRARRVGANEVHLLPS